MTPPPTSIDGTDITAATIDGQDVQEITIDGQTVFTAIPPNVIDNFEESLYDDQNKTLLDYYNGDVSGYERNTNAPVFEGSYSLKTTGSALEIVSDTLNTNPTRGDTFSFRVFCGSTSGNADLSSVLFNAVDTDNHFRAYYNSAGDMAISEYVNGDNNRLVGGNPASTVGEFVRGEVDWQSNDTITYSLETESGTLLDSIQTTISPFTDGSGNVETGFGFEGQPRSDAVVYDDAKIL